MVGNGVGGYDDNSDGEWCKETMALDELVGTDLDVSIRGGGDGLDRSVA